MGSEGPGVDRLSPGLQLSGDAALWNSRVRGHLTGNVVEEQGDGGFEHAHMTNFVFHKTSAE